MDVESTEFMPDLIRSDANSLPDRDLYGPKLYENFFPEPVFIATLLSGFVHDRISAITATFTEIAYSDGSERLARRLPQFFVDLTVSIETFTQAHPHSVSCIAIGSFCSFIKKYFQIHDRIE
jgi:hypothetical protein